MALKYFALAALAAPAMCADTPTPEVVEAPKLVPECAVKNKGYVDPDITTVNGGIQIWDAQTCQNTCRDSPECKVFTYYHDSGGCWLQGGHLVMQDIPGVTSGPKECEPRFKEAAAYKAAESEQVESLEVDLGNATGTTLPPKEKSGMGKEKSGKIPMWHKAAGGVAVAAVLGFCAYCTFCSESKKVKKEKKSRGLKPAPEPKPAEVEAPLMTFEQPPPMMPEPVPTVSAPMPMYQHMPTSYQVPVPAYQTRGYEMSAPAPQVVYAQPQVTYSAAPQYASAPVQYAYPPQVTYTQASATAPIQSFTAPVQSFAQIDANGDGVITREEFNQAMGR